MKNFFKQGITFVEIIIVIAILLIIIAIAVPNFNGLKKNQLLNNFNEEILLALNKAKSLSLSSLNSSEYGVHFSTNEVVFF
jgi:prepilin-type N-terminal cleavage/methylation domain-containing protein